MYDGEGRRSRKLATALAIWLSWHRTGGGHPPGHWGGRGRTERAKKWRAKHKRFVLRSTDCGVVPGLRQSSYVRNADGDTGTEYILCLQVVQLCPADSTAAAQTDVRIICRAGPTCPIISFVCRAGSFCDLVSPAIIWGRISPVSLLLRRSLVPGPSRPWSRRKCRPKRPRPPGSSRLC